MQSPTIPKHIILRLLGDGLKSKTISPAEVLALLGIEAAVSLECEASNHRDAVAAYLHAAAVVRNGGPLDPDE